MRQRRNRSDPMEPGFYTKALDDGLCWMLVIRDLRMSITGDRVCEVLVADDPEDPGNCEYLAERNCITKLWERVEL